MTYVFSQLRTQQTFILMKTSFVFVFKRRLQDVLIKTNISLLIIRLQKTSWSRPIYSSCPYVFKISSRIFQDFFKTTSRQLQDVFKTSSKRLQDVSQIRLEGIFKTFWRRIIKLNCFCKTSLWEVFNMFVRRTAKTVVYRRIHLGHTSEKFMVSVQNLQGW